MEGKPQNRMQEVSADEIGLQIQAYALYCGISPTGSNSTKALAIFITEKCQKKLKENKEERYSRVPRLSNTRYAAKGTKGK